MPKYLHIYISSDAGLPLIQIKHSLDDVQALQPILSEPYILSRLIDDSHDFMKLRAEIVKPIPMGRVDYKKEGVKRANIKRK